MFIAIQAIGQPTVLSNVINEGSNSYISGTFLDRSGNRVNPNTVTYTVSDVRTGNLLVPEITAARSPAGVGTPTPTYPSTLVLDLPICASRKFAGISEEKKRITIRFTYNSGTKLGTSEAEWNVHELENLIVVTNTPTPSAVGASPTPTKGAEDCSALTAPTPTNTPIP